MISEYLLPKRGNILRKNGTNELVININPYELNNIFLINGTSFITKDLSVKDLIIEPHNYYMIINNGKKKIQINYSHDIFIHDIIYNPYKYEHSKKVNFDPETFKKMYNIPKGFIDVLAKWYSIKFIYPDYNLIFIKPEMGISIQVHQLRSETWEIIEGNPIIINGNKVFYFVKNGTYFENSIKTYHSVINPNIDPENFVLIKEKWEGKFDEKDIERVFNPNKYY